MSAVAQWNNRKTRRDDFCHAKDDSFPSRRQILSNLAALRQHWSPHERMLRAQMAQLLQQQLLDRILSLPGETTSQALCNETNVA
jgi:hypothetical protein